MSARWSLPVDSEPEPGIDAPGRPGIPPTWTSSSKDAVGSSLGPSRLWFTLAFQRKLGRRLAFKMLTGR